MAKKGFSIDKLLPKTFLLLSTSNAVSNETGNSIWTWTENTTLLQSWEINSQVNYLIDGLTIEWDTVQEIKMKSFL